MNRVLHIIGFLLTIMIWNTCGVLAQEAVLRGSSHRYSISPVGVKSNYTYTWSVSGGTASVLGKDSISNNVLWDGPAGLYTLYVYPTNKANGCAGNIQSIQIQVIDFQVRWQGVSTTVCSALSNDSRDFSVVVEFSASQSPWSFDYQIDNAAPLHLTITGGTSKVLNLSGFINHSNAVTEIHTIRITRITLPDGHKFTFDGTESDAASHVYTVTVNPTPPIGTIEFIRDL